MVYYNYNGDYYIDDRLKVIQDVAIAGIVMASLAVLVLIVGCIYVRRIRGNQVASSAEKGLSMVVVQGTGSDGQSLAHPHQIQVQGPFFMTSHRAPDGEELVMREDKAQVEEQQQQPNLNYALAHSRSTNEPAVMTQRKFEKSVKVEQDGDEGAGIGSGSGDTVVIVEKEPSSSSSEKKDEIEEVKTSA
ncbi:hypothetical protein CPC16_011554 [Podila verticillata]|nr:hypothetical protein CPC16_011554 [Podila verticillata]